MRIRSTVPVLIALLAAQPAVAQQAEPDMQIAAQALDRCMATHAVQMTRTDASDEAIYAQATESCRGLDERLRAAITAQLPASQAAEVLAAIDAQAKPNFMALLARIRSDRARRAGG